MNRVRRIASKGFVLSGLIEIVDVEVVFSYVSIESSPVNTTRGIGIDGTANAFNLEYTSSHEQFQI